MLSAAVTSLATGASGVVNYNEVTVAQNIARSQLDFTLNDTYFPAPYSYPTITPPSGYTATSEAQAYPGSDDQMAQTTDLVDAAPPVGSLTLNWTDEFGGAAAPHTTVYSLGRDGAHEDLLR